MTLVNIKPEDFGLTSETAANIAAQFKPMLAKMEELEQEFNKVVAMPIGEPTTEKEAAALLRKYVKVRTGTAAIHKEQKAFYLAGGRFVDGWKNAQIMASMGKEEALQRIIDHRAELERQRIEKLQEERLALLTPYVDDTTGLDLGRMGEDVFQAYLAAAKQRKADAEAAAIAAQEELKRQEEARQLHNQRKDKLIPLWRFISEEVKNMDLSTLSDEVFANVLATATVALNEEERQKEHMRAEAQRLAAEKAEATRIAEEARKKAAEAEAELRRAQEKAAKEARERDEQARRAEIARREEEKARLAEEERQKQAPIKEQMVLWVNGLTIPPPPIDNATTAEIMDKFESFRRWGLNLIANI